MGSPDPKMDVQLSKIFLRVSPGYFRDPWNILDKEFFFIKIKDLIIFNSSNKFIPLWLLLHKFGWFYIFIEIKD